MEIETAALIRYDLCHRSKKERLLDNLQTLYDDEGQRQGESVFGGQQWDRFKFEGSLSSLDTEFTEFERTKTFVGFQPRHLVDIVTVAELNSSQIEELEEKQPNRTQFVIGELSELLTSIATEIPTVAPTEFNHQPVHLYIEPKQAQPVTGEEGEIDPELLSAFLEDSREELERIYYHVDHPQSLLDGEDLVTPQGTAFPWGRLTIFNLSAPPATESDFEPTWLRRLRPLREYLRTYLWFNHRVRLLSELDRETHGIEKLMRNAPSDASQLQEVLNIENELDNIREKWTDRYTKTVDEVADLRSRPPLQTPNGQELEPVKINEITDGSPVNSLLDIYDQQLATQTEQVTSDLDRIGSKLGEVSSYIQDKINVRATTATIHQQRATNYMTVGIVVLTVVLVIIALVDLFWIP